jgi:hypothetical protein
LKGTFLIGPIANASNFIISEVHYAPLPPGTPAEIAQASDASDFEFLEMRNISATDTIDLTDVHFVVGIDFTFTGSNLTTLAPGERVLIVCNQAAFEARYGTGHSDRIAGAFAPTRLDNAGERLHLVDALGATIADFTYNDKHPWPTESGFAGYSLVLKSVAVPSPDYTLADNWRSSTGLGGNPDSSDTTLLVGDPGADDDLDHFDKLLEHAFGTSDFDPADTNGTSSASLANLKVDDVFDDYLTITYRRNLAADDVVIIPELSVDLVTWLSGEAHLIFVSGIHQGDGTSLVTYRTALPQDPSAISRVFLRLRVSMP